MCQAPRVQRQDARKWPQWDDDAWCELKLLLGQIKIEIFDLALGKLAGKCACKAGIIEIQAVSVGTIRPISIFKVSPGLAPSTYTGPVIECAPRPGESVCSCFARAVICSIFRSGDLCVAVNQRLHHYRIPG